MKLFNNPNILNIFKNYTTDDLGGLGSSILITDNLASYDELDDYLYSLFNGASIFANPTDNISNILAFPIASRQYQHSGFLKCGNAEKSRVACDYSNRYGMLFRVAKFKYDGAYGDSFLSCNDYVKVKLYLPYFGLVDLNPNDILGKWVHIFLTASSLSPQATYIICSADIEYSELPTGNTNLLKNQILKNADFTPIQFIDFTLGHTIPMGRVDNSDTQRNMLISAMSVAGSIMFGSAPVPRSYSVETSTKTFEKSNTIRNPKTNRQIKSSGMKYRSDEYDGRVYIKDDYEIQKRGNECFKSGSYALNSFAQEVSTTAPANTSAMFAFGVDVGLIEYAVKYIYPTDEFNHLYGRPFGTTTKLSNLEGYTLISEVHLEGEEFRGMSSQEKFLLEQALYNGIIL